MAPAAWQPYGKAGCALGRPLPVLVPVPVPVPSLLLQLLLHLRMQSVPLLLRHAAKLDGYGAGARACSAMFTYRTHVWLSG